MGRITRALGELLGRSGVALEASSPRRGWPIERPAAVPGAGVPFGLDVVRRRSQHAAGSNPHMARAADAWTTALIGAGIALTSSHPSPDVRRDLQARFAAWGVRCDSEGRLDWPGLQAAVVRELVVSGEAFVHLRPTPAGLRLRLIPGDLVDASLNRDLPGGGFIHAGVEHDSEGARVAYHVFRRRPDGFASVGSPVRLPAADVLHVFRPLAPGQVRGVPWAAPVLLTLAEQDGLSDALLVGARVAAMHAGFLIDQNGIGGATPYEGVQVGSVLESGLEPGTLKILPAGFDIRFSTPAAATAGIELAKLNLRSVAAGLGLPEHVLTGDMGGANYSSLRAALVEWRQRIEQIQFQVLIPQLLRPVWERWVELGALTGELDAPDGDAADYLAAEFYPPAQPWVDPLKDAEAESALIAAGLKSRRQAVAAQGYDVEALDSEIAADRAREAALGLSFTTPARGVPDAE